MILPFDKVSYSCDKMDYCLSIVLFSSVYIQAVDKNHTPIYIDVHNWTVLDTHYRQYVLYLRQDGLLLIYRTISTGNLKP